LLVCMGHAPVAPAAPGTLVYAAASLTGVLQDIQQTYAESNPAVEVTLSLAASSTLARQIRHGARADIYISANTEWLDYLQESADIAADSRTALLANGLVLIAPAHSDIAPTAMDNTLPLVDLLGDGYLAMGNPAHVPAGVYGKQALQALQLWSAVRGRIARATNVRAALALVATGEARLGIVYRTDALAADDVRIVGTFPAATHDPIIYAAALTPAGRDND